VAYRGIEAVDLSLPLDQVAEGDRAMDERRAIKALLRPSTTMHVGAAR
jgi:hypothetical protein